MTSRRSSRNEPTARISVSDATNSVATTIHMPNIVGDSTRCPQPGGVS